MVMYLHNACASILPSLSNVCPVPMPYNISNMKIKREVLNTQNLSLFMHLNPKSKIELPSMQISAAFANMANRLFVILDPQNLFSGRNVHIIIPDFFEGIFEDVSKCVLFTVDRTARQNAAVPVDHRFCPREHTPYPLLPFCRNDGK